MTKKEFIKRMNKIKRKNLDIFGIYTCQEINFELGYKGRIAYQKIIEPYLKYNTPFISRDYLDSRGSRKTVRILALTTFEIECLESGIYKEFQNGKFYVY